MAKNVPPGSENFFGNDLPKRIQAIKNKKYFLEKEKMYYQNEKICKTLETITGNGYQKQVLQEPSKNFLQKKGKIPKEADISVVTTSIAEELKFNKNCTKFKRGTGKTL